MRITTNNFQNGKSVNFQKGLTSKEIKAVENMSPCDYTKISKELLNNYNLSATFRGSNTVAWCVKQVANIFKKAGFELPLSFEFSQNDRKVLGIFEQYSNKVKINSYYEEFRNLKKQNILEESQGNFHPETRHFLQTYLHEFSHAAHFNNLCLKFGKYEANIIFEKLKQLKPTEYLISPEKYAIKTQVPKFLRKPVDWLIPTKNGLYAQKNLVEYFAEYNARVIADILLYHEDIDIACKSEKLKTLKSSYVDVSPVQSLWERLGNALKHAQQRDPFLNAGKNIITLIEEHPVCKVLSKDLYYTNCAIFNGNIECLEKKIQDLLYFTKK